MSRSHRDGKPRGRKAALGADGPHGRERTPREDELRDGHEGHGPADGGRGHEGAAAADGPHGHDATGRADGPPGDEAPRRADGPRPGDQAPAVDEQQARGMRTRREVLGDAHVDRAVASTTPFTAPFQDFITRTAWGDVWSRPGLDRRTRSCVTLAILVTLRAEDELAMHVRAALRNGLTAAEIGEVILHAAVYAGVPAANTAMAIAARVLAEEGVPAATTDPEEPPDEGRGR